MYSVLDYGRMAADPVRMDAYARAIERVVRPGHVVLDIGAGTGIFSILAARAGAKHVHAIEPNPAIWLLSELAAENGVADRITLHHATTYEAALSERADVVIADLRGILPLHEENASVLRDARQRLLKPSGVVIPARDHLRVALVEADGMWRWLARTWESFERRGVAARAMRSSVLNTPYSDRAHPIASSDVLSDGPRWATLDYASYEGSVVEGTVELSVTRGGVAHGFAVWFEAELAGDIGFETGPGSSMIYSRFFLPLLEPLSVRAGGRVALTLRADARGERWAWDTTSARGRERQSTFLGQATAPEALLRESSTYRPTRTDRGARVRSVLEQMDGERTVEELARSFASDLPDGSPLRGRAIDEVREIVNRYAR